MDFEKKEVKLCGRFSLPFFNGEFMAKVKMYINREIAEMCGCSFSTVVKYAEKPENEINFVGKGRRKTYVWFDEDVERFKLRTAVVGRPSKESRYKNSLPVTDK